MIFRMDVWMYGCMYGCMYVALTGGHILGRISTKLGMMDGCRMGMVTVSGRHGPVITAVTVG